MANRLVVLGGGVVVIACCAGLPAIGAAFGGLTVGAVLGVVAGLITAAVLGAGATLWIGNRRRRTRAESPR